MASLFELSGRRVRGQPPGARCRVRLPAGQQEVGVAQEHRLGRERGHHGGALGQGWEQGPCGVGEGGEQRAGLMCSFCVMVG